MRQTEIDVSPNSDSITLSIKCRKALLESEMPYSGLSDSRITVCSLMTTSLVSLLGGIPISYALRSIAIPEGNRMNMFSRFFLIVQVTGYRKMIMRDSEMQRICNAGTVLFVRLES